MEIAVPSVLTLSAINNAISSLFVPSLTLTTKALTAEQALVWLFHEVPLDFWNELVYREAISQYKRDTCDLLELLEWTDSIFANHLSLEDAKAAKLLATIVIGGVGPIVLKNGIWEQVSCGQLKPTFYCPEARVVTRRSKLYKLH